MAKKHKRFIVAIDGRCGSGKTTVAGVLGKRLDAVVFHMDDFYLQKHQRIEERYNEPGGNVDRERWIPLEEKYFDELEIRKYADRVFKMSAGEK